MHIKSLNQFSSLALRRGWKERHSNWRLEEKADYWDGQKKATSPTSQKCSSLLLVSRNHEADWIFTLGVGVIYLIYSRNPEFSPHMTALSYPSSIKCLSGKNSRRVFPPHAANASLIMLEFLRSLKLFKSYGSLKKHWTKLSQWQVSGLHKEKDGFFHYCYKDKRVPFYFAFNFVSWLLAWRTFDDFWFLKVLTTESLSAADGKKKTHISIHSDFFLFKVEKSNEGSIWMSTAVQL